MEVDSREQGSRDVVSGVREPPEPASRTAVAPEALCERLAPGPGRLTPEQVASHQRARIYSTMIEIVAERGYGAVTVRELVRLAGVAPRTFYEHFADTDECFLVTYDVVVARAARRIVEAQRLERDWRARLCRAFQAFVRELVREPKAARLALVEAFGAGPAAIERMEHANRLFEGMVATSFEHAPDRIVPPPIVVKGIVAGIARVARARLLAGRAHELPDLADELLEWTLCFRCPEAAELAKLAAVAPPRAGALLAGGPGEAWDDRAQILDAVARLAAQGGYWQLTIPRIRAAAGVSRGCFDEHFEDVQGCFMAALEQLTERALARAAAEGAAGRTWPGGLHRALTALCAHVAADAAFARLAFVEVFAPGPDGMRCRERVIGGVAESFHASAPAAQRPSELAAEASIGAVWGIVHRYVAAGRADRLPRVAGLLSFLALAPAIGAGAALEAIAAEQARPLPRPRR